MIVNGEKDCAIEIGGKVFHSVQEMAECIADLQDKENTLNKASDMVGKLISENRMLKKRIDELSALPLFDINKLAQDMYEVARKRHENGGLPIDTLGLLKHCAGEVIEATEAFSIASNIDIELEKRIDYYGSYTKELADIIACVLIMLAKGKFDIKKLLTDCLEKNKARAEGNGDKK